ncbi:Stp1/IreP family PP2C-type Ser/Thr phosphatase [SAR202 cluster bacterium AD-804-J14_MRT_500m]|nr:Stp1/IreP family PP2C-type Ser/Thr phosphatase [SAR202 cluster bacterium AD-804-J14_MRT_500m]
MKRISLGHETHVGLVRTANQDRYIAKLAPHLPLNIDALIAVADGMGGHKGGEVASKLAVEAVLEALTTSNPDDSSTNQDILTRKLKQAVLFANNKIYNAAKDPNFQGMGTTLTVIVIKDMQAILAHVGDSRAYLVRHGEICQLTNDHSWVEEQVRAGIMSPEAASEDPRRNILTRAVGTNPTVEVETSVVNLEQNDTLLLCSDGLHSLVNNHEIFTIVDSFNPAKACVRLVAAANERGGNDNTTVVISKIVQVQKRSQSREKTAVLQSSKTVYRSRRSVKNLISLLLKNVVNIPFFVLKTPFWVCFKTIKFVKSKGHS